jgi:hypothetical protein
LDQSGLIDGHDLALQLGDATERIEELPTGRDLAIQM